MKKIKEFFRDLVDNNPWTVAFISIVALGFFCHWLSVHTIVGEIVNRWSDDIAKSYQLKLKS